MQVYADLLAKRAVERHALLFATDLTVGKQSRSNPLDGGPLEEDEEGRANDLAVLSSNGGLAAAASRADGEAPDDQTGLFSKLPGQAAKRRRIDNAAVASANDTVSTLTLRSLNASICRWHIMPSNAVS